MGTRTSISTSINLPVESLQTIVDVNDSRVEIDINEAMKRSKGKSDESIQSMNAIAFSTYKDIEKKKFDHAVIEYSTFNINEINRRKIERTNEIKFYDVKIEFCTGIVKEFTVPSYVKFYSSQRGIFVPVEYVRNRDILLDYTGNIAKINDTVLNESFKMTDFYNMNVVYDIEEYDLNEYMKVPSECNFYLNGVLTNTPYNNFQKKED